MSQLALELIYFLFAQRLEKGGADPQQLEAIRQQQRELYQQMRRNKNETQHSKEVAEKGAE